jgi:PIN domain nuclease of toxin-antitoxin system
MASVIYLDTHVVGWMFAGRTDLLAGKARQVIEEREILISPAVELELQYLFEIHRTAEPARKVVETLGREVGLRVCELPFSRVVEVALEQSWTRDPFDRLITSHAMLAEAPLITKDGTIREHYSRAIWGD